MAAMEQNGMVGYILLRLYGDVTDVCGAGDTFLAALVYKFLETKHMPDAIKFANQAAAVTVQHVGVYAPRLEEIK